jgi:DNA modification methylase
MDCLEGMKQLDNFSCDLIVTSPPYNKNHKGVSRKYHNQIHYEDNKDESDYRNWVLSVIDEGSRLLKNHGSMWVNLKNRTQNKICVPPFWILGQKNLFLRNIVIWATLGSQEGNKTRFNTDYEFFFWFVKDIGNYYSDIDAVRIKPRYDDPRQNPLGANPGCIWYETQILGNCKERTKHPAQYPVNLIKRIILSSSKVGDIVLDPFMGSGTTAVSSKKLSRKFIGFEIEDKYCLIANDRLRKTFPIPLEIIKQKQETLV